MNNEKSIFRKKIIIILIIFYKYIINNFKY